MSLLHLVGLLEKEKDESIVFEWAYPNIGRLSSLFSLHQGDLNQAYKSVNNTNRCPLDDGVSNYLFLNHFGQNDPLVSLPFSLPPPP
jgi:hypothetical protein